MSRMTQSNSLERLLALVVSTVGKIRGSLTYFIWTCGVVMLLLGVIMSEGSMAGILGIFGVAALIYGALIYAGARLIGYE